MKIVDRKTFLGLPPGTLFSKFEPMIFGDLSIKEETISDSEDFYYQQISDAVAWEYPGEFFDILYIAMKTGESLKMDFDCPTRDGLFDENQLFAIWERDDVMALISRLEKTNVG